ncbi:F-box-like domain-containing protein [Purpureocillium lilacinum]|uniref:F-box-like domain-containing protein n=1 Tax=Purpureocillium lilacinum TaxID=33203 RepID=A0A179FUR3_PURLI|nr:F-box-like domain-containing protein [Purpureocillium lilacinum]
MAVPSSASIEKLPAEVLLLITNELSNRELKNLRSTSRFFSTVTLRIHRVFLSPNPRNVDVFLAIANHDAYRSKVVEIIYDNARLPRSAAEARRASDPGYYHSWDLPTAEEDDLTWFAKCREENIFTLNGHRG